MREQRLWSEVRRVRFSEDDDAAAEEQEEGEEEEDEEEEEEEEDRDRPPAAREGGYEGGGLEYGSEPRSQRARSQREGTPGPERGRGR